MRTQVGIGAWCGMRHRDPPTRGADAVSRDEANRREYLTAEGAIAAARADERARIVAWLRAEAARRTAAAGHFGLHTDPVGAVPMGAEGAGWAHAADAIERGEDRRG